MCTSQFGDDFVLSEFVFDSVDEWGHFEIILEAISEGHFEIGISA
jgi:peptidase E